MALCGTGKHASQTDDAGGAEVIFASSLGTVFEWYDFYLYGSLSRDRGPVFLGREPDRRLHLRAARLRRRLRGAAVRRAVLRPARRLSGRKYTFLVTITIMGLSTFIVGLPAELAAIGLLAPVILIALRLLQGLALGGEYGGAATYVAEHAPQAARLLHLVDPDDGDARPFLSLLVILGVPLSMTPDDFNAWGWRIPFLVSIVLLGISVWIRLKLNESPAFQKMKDEGTTSKAPLTESFLRWKNLKIVLLALFGLVAGQAVVWYTGQFYALFFLTQTLKVDAQSANLMIAAALLLGTPFFIIFGGSPTASAASRSSCSGCCWRA